MAIPESYSVDVNITREDQPQGAESFGIVLFAGTSDVIGQTERVRIYDELKNILADFGSLSEEYKAGQAFFSQTERPEFMKIARLLTGDVPGFMQGLTVSTPLSGFQAVSDGEFSVTIDGVQEDIIGLDFSLDASFADVALNIETAIQAIGTGGYTDATVSHNATTNKFTITSGTTGDLSSVSFLAPVSGGGGTDISGASFLNALSGESIPGVTAGATIVDEIEKIILVDNNWYFLTLHKGVRDNPDVLLAAAFVGGLTKVYATVSNDETVKDGQVSSDIISQLKATNNPRVWACAQFASSSEYLDVAACAVKASVDFNAANSVINMAYKPMSNITVDSLTSNQLSIVAGSRSNTDDKHGNVFIKYEGGVNRFVFGKVSNGEYVDIIHGTDWLAARIRELVFSLLINSPSLPYTDGGIAKIGNYIAQALNEGIKNGLLSGSASNFQHGQAFIINLPAAISIPPIDRASRVVSGITFKAVYAGAINFAVISGTITV
jgi:hypothetical protein